MEKTKFDHIPAAPIGTLPDGTRVQAGPTHKFPEGKLNPNDDGELNIALSHDQGLVLVHFGTPTVWFGMPPQAAYDLAHGIIHHARAEAVATGVTLQEVEARAAG